MHSFLSKVFGRKEKDTETSPTTLRLGELLDGKFEAISPNVSPSAGNFLELDPQTGGENGKDKDKDKDARFSLFKSKSRPSPPEITYKTPIPLPQLSLNFAATNGEPSSRTLESFLSVDPDAHILLSDAIIGRRRLNPLEALVLIRACSQAIVARGLETLGVMHPHWYSASPDIQRRLLSQFIHSMEPKTPLTAISLTPALATSPFESEINFTRSPHDVAAVLRWGLRHLQLESDSFGTDDGWYKAFLDAEAAAEYPPKAFSEKLAPALPKAHLDLLTASLEIFSSLAAHSEANSTSGSKLSKTFGLWLLTSRRVEDKDNWKSFYARWERMGRTLEHLFLSRIRDESTDQRMPVRLLELVRRYPYTHGLSPPTTDLQFLSPPHFTTRRYDALYVRIEVELSSERRKPKLKVHPLNILADAFSTKVEGGEYAELWAKITAASKTGTNPSPLSNIFADETIRFLSIVPDKGADKAQEAKSPVFSLLSPSSARPHSASVGETDRPAPSPSRGHSFSVGEQSRPSSARHQHSKSATEPPPPASATSQIGSDWAQFSSSGFLDSTPAIAPLVSTLFDTDLEKTTPVTTTLSRKSSKRGKAVSRKSVDFASEPAPPVSPPPAEPVKKEATAIVRATQLEVIELDEAFIDFWSDSLLDPITASWPTFIICKFKSTLVPDLLYGRIEEGQKQKTLTWLVLEQAFTVRPAPPPSPSSVPLSDSARPVSPALSTSGRNRFSFWSMSRTASSSSQTSQKGKKKEKALNVGEMGELLEEDATEQAKEDIVKLKAAPSKSRKSNAEKSIEPVAGPVDTPIAQEVAKVAVAEAQTPVADIQVPVAESKVPTVGVQTPAAEAQAHVPAPVVEAEAPPAEVQAAGPEAHSLDADMQPSVAESAPRADEATVQAAGVQAPAVDESPAAADVHVADVRPRTLLAEVQPPVTDEVAPVEATEGPPETPSIAEEIKPSVREASEAQVSTLEAAIAEAQSAPIVERAVTPQVGIESSETVSEANPLEPESWDTVDEYPSAAQTDLKASEEDSSTRTESEEVNDLPAETSVAQEAVDISQHPEEASAPVDESNTEDEEILDNLSSEILEESSFEVIAPVPTVEKETAQPAESGEFLSSAEESGALLAIPPAATEIESPSADESLTVSVERAIEQEDTPSDAAVLETIVTPEDEEKQESISDIDFAEVVQPKAEDVLPVDEVIHDTEVALQIETAQVAPTHPETPIDAGTHGLSDAAALAEELEVNNTDESAAPTSVVEATSDEIHEGHPEPTEQVPADVEGAPERSVTESLPSPDGLAGPINIVSSVPVIEPLGVPEQSPADALVDLPAIPLVDADPTHIVPSGLTHITIPIENVSSEELTTVQEASSSNDEELPDSHLSHEATILSGSTPAPHVALSLADPISEDTALLAKDATEDVDTSVSTGLEGEADESGNAPIKENTVSDIIVDEKTSAVIADSASGEIDRIPQDVDAVVDEAPLAVSAVQETVIEDSTSDNANPAVSLNAEASIVGSIDSNADKVPPTEELLSEGASGPRPAVVEPQSVVELATEVPLTEGTPATSDLIAQSTSGAEDSLPEAVPAVAEPVSEALSNLPEPLPEHIVQMSEGKELSIQGPVVEQSIPQESAAEESLAEEAPAELIAEHSVIEESPDLENHTQDDVPATQEPFAHRVIGEQHATEILLPEPVSESTAIVSAEREITPEDPLEHVLPGSVEHVGEDDTGILEGIAAKAPSESEVAYHIPPETTSNPAQVDDVHNPNVQELLAAEQLVQGLVATQSVDEEQSQYQTEDSVVKPMIVDVLSAAPIQAADENIGVDDLGTNLEENLNAPEDSVKDLTYEHPIVEQLSDISTVDADLSESLIDEVVAEQEPVIPEQAISESVSHSTGHFDAGEGSSEISVMAEESLAKEAESAGNEIVVVDDGTMEEIAQAEGESIKETSSSEEGQETDHSSTAESTVEEQGIVEAGGSKPEPIEAQEVARDGTEVPTTHNVSVEEHAVSTIIEGKSENVLDESSVTELQVPTLTEDSTILSLVADAPIILERSTEDLTQESDTVTPVSEQGSNAKLSSLPEATITSDINTSAKSEGPSTIEAPSASLTEGEAVAEDIIATNVEESTLESTNDPVDEAPISDAEKAELNPTASAESEIPAASQEPATEDTINATIVETVEPTKDSVGHDSPLDQSIDGHLSATEDVVREVTSEKDYTVNEASTKGPELHQLEESIEPASFVEILTDEVEPSASVVAEEPNDRVDTSSIGVQEASSDSTVAETAQSKRPSEESSIVVKGPEPILATEETISAKDTSKEPATISIADDIDTSEPTPHWLELEQPVTDSAVEEVPMTTIQEVAETVGNTVEGDEPLEGLTEEPIQKVSEEENALDATVPKDLSTDLPPPTKEPITSNYEDVETTTTSEAVEGTEDSSGTAKLELPSELSPVEPAELTTIVEVDGVDAPSTESEPRPIEETPNVEPSTSTADNLSEQVNGGMLDKSPDKDDVVVIEPIPNDISEEEAGTNDGLPAKDATIEYAQNLIEPASHSEELVFLPVENTSESDSANNGSTSVSDETDLTTIKLPESHLNQSSGTTKVLIASSNPEPEPADISASPVDTPDEIHHVLDQVTLSEDPIGAEGLTEEQATKDEARDVTIADELIADQSEGISPLFVEEPTTSVDEIKVSAPVPIHGHTIELASTSVEEEESVAEPAATTPGSAENNLKEDVIPASSEPAAQSSPEDALVAVSVHDPIAGAYSLDEDIAPATSEPALDSAQNSAVEVPVAPVENTVPEESEPTIVQPTSSNPVEDLSTEETVTHIPAINLPSEESTIEPIEPVSPQAQDIETVGVAPVHELETAPSATEVAVEESIPSTVKEVSEEVKLAPNTEQTTPATDTSPELSDASTVEEPDEEAKTTLDTQIIRTVDVTPARPEPELEPSSVPVIGLEDFDPSAIDISPQFEQAELVTKADIESSPAPLTDEAIKPSADIEQGSLTSVEPAISAPQPVVEEFASSAIEAPAETATEVEQDTAVEVVPENPEPEPSAPEVAINESIPLDDEAAKAPSDNEQATPGTFASESAPSPLEPVTEEFAFLSVYELVETATKIEPDTAVEVLPTTSEPTLEPPVPEAAIEESIPSAEEPVNAASDVEQTLTTDVEPQTFASESSPSTLELAAEEFVSSVIEEPAGTVTEVEPQTAEPELEPSAPEATVEESIPLVEETGNTVSEIQQATPEIATFESAPSAIEATPEFVSPTVDKPIQAGTEIEVVPTTSEPELEPSMLEAAVKEITPSVQEPGKAAFDSEKHLITDVVPETSTVKVTTGVDVVPATPEPASEPLEPSLPQKESVLVSESAPSLTEDPVKATLNAEQAPSSDVMTSEPALEPSGLEATVVESDPYLVAELAPSTVEESANTTSAAATSTSRPSPEHFASGNSTEKPTPATVEELAPSATEESASTTSDVEQVEQVPSASEVAPFIPEPTPETTAKEPAPAEIEELTPSTVEEPTLPTSDAAPSSSESALEFGAQETIEEPASVAIEELPLSAIEELISTTPHISSASDAVLSSSEPAFESFVSVNTTEEPALSVAEGPDDEISDAKDLTPEPESERSVLETTEEPASAAIEQLVPSVIQESVSATSDIEQVPSVSDTTTPSSEPALEPSVLETTAEEPAPIAIEESESSAIEEIANITSDVPPFSDAAPSSSEPALEYTELETTTEESAPAAIDEHVPSVIEEPVSATADAEQIPSASDSAPSNSEPALKLSSLETNNQEPAALAIEGLTLSTAEEPAIATSDATPSSSEPVLEDSALQATTEELSPAPIEELAPSVIQEPVSTTTDVEHVPSASDIEPSSSEPALEPSAVEATTEEYDLAAIEEPVGATPDAEEVPPASDAAPSSSEPASEPSPLEHTSEEPAPAAIEELAPSSVEEPVIAHSDATPSSSEPAFEDSALETATEELDSAVIADLAVPVIEEPISVTTDVEHVPSTSDIADPALEHSALEATTEGHAPAAVDEPDPSAIEEPVGATSDTGEVPSASEIGPSSSEPALEPSAPEHTSEEPAPASIEELALSSVEEPVNAASEDKPPSSEEPSAPEAVIEEPVPAPVEVPTETVNAIAEETVSVQDLALAEDIPITIETVAAEEPALFDEDDTLDAAAAEEFDDLISPITDGSAMDPDASFATSGPFALESVASSIGEDDEDLVLDVDTKISEAEDDALNGSGNGHHSKLDTDISDLVDDGIDSPLAEAFDSADVADEAGNGHVHVDAQPSIVEVPSGGSTEPGTALAVLDASGEQHIEKFDLSGQDEPKEAHVDVAETTDSKTALPTATEA